VLSEIYGSQFLIVLRDHRHHHHPAGYGLQFLQELIGQRLNDYSLFGFYSEVLTCRTLKKKMETFEELFVIFKIRGFSRNLRKEISKMNKYCFYDTGIRNYLINNFNSTSQRNDIGQLRETC
jgi:predicted AAA+ superfamily ATPase